MGPRALDRLRAVERRDGIPGGSGYVHTGRILAMSTTRRVPPLIPEYTQSLLDWLDQQLKSLGDAG
jgi:hypothetical protein